MKSWKLGLVVVVVCGLTLVGWAAGRQRGTSGAKVKVYGDATVERVIAIADAKTFILSLKDLPPIVGENIPVRVNGIDTPDLTGGRRETRELAFGGRQTVIAEFKAAKVIKLKNMRRDPGAFRIIADVEVDGRNLAKILLDGGYAKSYTGGTRPKW
jgi:endonuclease YncB( thermonuclease family)